MAFGAIFPREEACDAIELCFGRKFGFFALETGDGRASIFYCNLEGARPANDWVRYCQTERVTNGQGRVMDGEASSPSNKRAEQNAHSSLAPPSQQDDCALYVTSYGKHVSETSGDPFVVNTAR